MVKEVIAAALAVVEETAEAEEATFKIEDAQSPEDNHRIIQDHNHKPEVLAIVAEKTVMCPILSQLLHFLSFAQQSLGT